jgi:putative DNA primase/helicase
MIDLSQVATAFADAMRTCGIEPPLEIIADGAVHRFNVGVERRGRKAGAYRLYPDGVPAGWFQSHKGSGGLIRWSSKGPTHPMDREAVRQFRAEVAACRATRAQQDVARRQEAAERAYAQWERSPAAEADHPYLAAKGVQPHGLRVDGELLLVPVRDALGALQSIQTIAADGTKRFLPGGRKTGCYFSIGKSADVVVICEGYATGASLHEATGHYVAVAFDCGNLRPVAEAIRAKLPEACIIMAADDDHRTHGNPGRTKAAEAARAVGGRVAVPEFGDDRQEKDTDFNDLHQRVGLDAVRACAEAAQPAVEVKEGPQTTPAEPEVGEPAEDSRRLSELAALPPIDYDRVRDIEAKRMSVRVSTLDAAVAKLRPASGAGKAGMFPSVEPWPEAVDGEVLLHEIRQLVRRFIVCEPEVRSACALWIAFTWMIEHVNVAPLAVITAPEPRCGKSNMLDFIGRLSMRPLVASNVSPAAVFRVIEAHRPTLLIDEADSFLKDNDELRGVINSGHTRASAYVIRTVGDDHEPKQFSTWGAKAISGIGRMPQTIMDRAIVLELRRKMQGEHVEKLRHADTRDFERLRRMLARFAGDAGPTVERARPEIPATLNDRAADNWEPLLSIADAAGGGWPVLARSAALKLSGVESEPLSLTTELLADVRDVFERENVPRISSADLLRALCDDDEGPWATYNRGKPMTPRTLARLLSAYQISSKTIRIGYDTPKGFDRAQFADAFCRYLSIETSSTESATTPQPSNGAASVAAEEWRQDSSSATSAGAGHEGRGAVADSAKCGATEKDSATLEPVWNQACGFVADTGGFPGGNGASAVPDPERFE